MGACRLFAGWLFMQAASPGVAIVLLRYIMLGAPTTPTYSYPFLLAACYSAPVSRAWQQQLHAGEIERERQGQSWCDSAGVKKPAVARGGDGAEIAVA